VRRGEPRKIIRDPTSREYIHVHCGTLRAVAASNVLSMEQSQSSPASRLNDVYVMASVPVFVYEGRSYVSKDAHSCTYM
jgi:hypothetical protein